MLRHKGYVAPYVEMGEQPTFLDDIPHAMAQCHKIVGHQRGAFDDDGATVGTGESRDQAVAEVEAIIRALPTSVAALDVDPTVAAALED